MQRTTFVSFFLSLLLWNSKYTVSWHKARSRALITCFMCIGPGQGKKCYILGKIWIIFWIQKNSWIFRITSWRSTLSECFPVSNVKHLPSFYMYLHCYRQAVLCGRTAREDRAFHLLLYHATELHLHLWRHRQTTHNSWCIIWINPTSSTISDSSTPSVNMKCSVWMSLVWCCFQHIVWVISQWVVQGNPVYSSRLWMCTENYKTTTSNYQLSSFISGPEWSTGPWWVREDYASHCATTLLLIVWTLKVSLQLNLLYLFLCNGKQCTSY